MNGAAHRRLELAVVVLTRDESLNLPRCLESVRGWAGEIHVVDSGSADGTVEIAARCGARVWRHAFTTHAEQWNWVLATLPLEAEWILALDADQRVTPELAGAIAAELARTPPSVNGFYVKRRQIFRGRWIRYGGYYPKHLLKLFRRGTARADETERVDHRFVVTGEVRRLLRGDLVEENLKENDLSRWCAKHLAYAARQAAEEHERRLSGREGLVPPRLFGTPDERVVWLKRIWYRMPLYLRPFVYFGFRYVLRLGFLDGKQGFIFHFLQGFWYRLMVDIELDELRRSARLPREAPSTEPVAGTNLSSTP